MEGVAETAALHSLTMKGPWGDAIRLLRLQRERETGEKWSQARVAKLARMSPTTYGKIEAGGHTQTQKLEDIATALGADFITVLGLQTSGLATDARPVQTTRDPTSPGASNPHGRSLPASSGDLDIRTVLVAVGEVLAESFDRAVDRIVDARKQDPDSRARPPVRSTSRRKIR
jgi:transcriptional regulator with XRE-family HTH domain